MQDHRKVVYVTRKRFSFLLYIHRICMDRGAMWVAMITLNGSVFSLYIC